MSTKIYNGYISTLNIEQLLNEFISIRDKFENKKIQLYNKILGNQVANKIDSAAIAASRTMTGEEQYAILNETHDINERSVKDEVVLRGEKSHLDLSSDCVVFPMGKRKTLILFYCENKELTAIWERLRFIKEYHYQNQTDKPRGISEKNWDQRKRDWDKALGYDVPINRGYCFTFTQERLPVFIKRSGVSAFVPDEETRILYQMKEKYVNSLIKKLTEKDKDKDHSRLFEYYRRARDSWEKYKGTKAFEKEKKETKKYISNITFI